MFDFPAAFDLPTVERLETTAQQSAKQNGIDRRLAFATLTKSAAELRQVASQDPELLLTCAESLRGAIEWHEGQIKLLRTAEARILAALSDVFPETGEDQPDAAARDEAQTGGVISDEQEVPHD